MPAFKHLTKLFPAPSPPRSVLAPVRWPGINPSSTGTLLNTLKDNHEKWHIFFNDRGFHNHASHHLLAIWSMGASAPVISAAYQTHVDYMRPAFPSPEPITSSNIYDHLADEKYYQGYLAYFTLELLAKPTSQVIEEQIFAQSANFDDKRAKAGKEQPEMLNRFLAGILHPLIHTGYGVEFGLDGLVAEGLAQAALHKANNSPLLPPELFKDDSVSGLSSLMPSMFVSQKPPPSTSASIHSLEVLARLLKDDANFSPPEEKPGNPFADLLDKKADKILAAMKDWTVDGASEVDVAEKLSQVIWLNSILYGVGGWSPEDHFSADFTLMHLVTSSIFLSSLLPTLTSPTSKSRLLRAYMAVSLSWYLARGRPAIPLKEFFSAKSSATPNPEIPGPKPSPANDTLPSPDSQDAQTPNPWLPIIQSALVHPNEHLCKLVRSLENYSRLYGNLSAEELGFGEKAKGLEGAEKIDGTLFIRVAGMTIGRLGWMREGQGKSGWDFEGFFGEHEH